MNETFAEMLSNEMAKRNNPNDLKSGIIGKIVQVEPIIVSIDNGKILLSENEELEISEWFRFRCKLGKNADDENEVDTTVSTAIKDLTGSCDAKVCNLSSVVSSFKIAINSIKNELLALKCDLKKNDFVSVASLEENGKYILLDKVL